MLLEHLKLGITLMSISAFASFFSFIKWTRRIYDLSVLQFGTGKLIWPCLALIGFFSRKARKEFFK